MFQETLDLSLRLTIDSDVFDIPGGNIKALRLELRPWGFSGELTFRVYGDESSDTLPSRFASADLMEVDLSVQGFFNLPTPAPEPLALKGLVREHSLRELMLDGTSGLLSCRDYTVAFADRPQVLWSQHFPVRLYVDETVAGAIAEQKVRGLDLVLTAKRLLAKSNVVSLNLGAASFYDFVCWLAEHWQLTLVYDYLEASFGLVDGKVTPTLFGLEKKAHVSGFEVELPAPPRYKPHVLNAFASAKALNVEVPSTQAVEPLRDDRLIRSEVLVSSAARTTLEKARLKLAEPGVRLVYGSYPDASYLPGCLMRFESGGWSKFDYLYGSSWRVHSVDFSAKADELGDRPEATGVYQVELGVGLEHVDDERQHLPAFRTPRWPFYVEGKIVSELGEDEEHTWQTYPDPNTSLIKYTVSVPLWNKKVVVPFEPGHLPSHFHFPLWKDQRVLLAVDFLSARIERFLEWGPEVQLPTDGQGHHILMGMSDTNFTTMIHQYASDKPSWKLRRVFGQDTETVLLSEGAMLLSTEEDASLEKVEEKYDVTPKKLASQAELKMEGGAAVSNLTTEYETGAAAVTTQLEDAVNETSDALDGMEEDIKAKAGEVEAVLDGALGALDGASGQLSGAVGSAKSDLEALRGL